MSFPRRHTRITYEGVSFLSILAFIVLGSILRQINLLILLSGLMIAPFFFNWRISMKMIERLTVKRSLPKWVHAGKPFSVAWRIENHRNRIPAWGIRIVDHVKYEGTKLREAEPITVLARPVEPGTTGHVHYRCLLPERGICEFGPADASSTFPTGLIRSMIKHAELQTLIVAPPLGKLTAAWSRFVQSHWMGEQSRRRTRGNNDEEFYALRRWKSGDSRRSIHWRSSAKHGELMVRQYDQPSDQRLFVVLDLHAGQSTRADIDYAVSFLATIIDNSSRSRIQFGVGVFGDHQLIVEPSSSSRATSAVMPALATVQASPQTGVFKGIRQLVGESAQASTIVISTRSLAEATAGEASLDAAASRFRWIDVRDGQSREWFVPSTSDTDHFVSELQKIATP